MEVGLRSSALGGGAGGAGEVGLAEAAADQVGPHCWRPGGVALAQSLHSLPFHILLLPLCALAPPSSSVFHHSPQEHL